ncbi:MAG TPA: SpoIIE family protein phosphatase [Roseiflexaceae bacterium]|nr:SpoIIE family protein phosphatase [Roseiflexaceae bacterium]
MSRELRLIVYCFIVGALGWLWLLSSASGIIVTPILVFFLFMALLIESAGFRVPPADPHSLVGVVLLTAATAFGPESGALVAALSGLIFGAAAPLFYGRARTLYLLVARPFLRSGVRAIAILSGAALADAVLGAPADGFERFALQAVCFALVIQSARAIREYLQGGSSGLATWWRSAWQPMLSAEVAPLPLAWLGAAIYRQLGLDYFVLACAALLAGSLSVRRASRRVQLQRRSVRELGLLNQTSRAINRAEMDVEALCELIYRETSKIVDTSSFHLGLFAPSGDTYTLVVRVQDRVRLPPLTVQLPAGDGIIGWMRATGHSLLVEDFAVEMNQLPARPRYQSERPPRSGIYVPLLTGDEVIGTISIQSYRPRTFSTDDLRLLSLIADQAAVAISKARTYDSAQLRAVQLAAIHEVSERITAILEIDNLLPSVVHLIRERFGYHPVHIFLQEPHGRLVFRASTASLANLKQFNDWTLRSGSGLVGLAAQDGQPILVNDVRADPRYISDDRNTRSEMAVPLRFGNESLGVLDVQSELPNRFTDADMFVMQTLAGQIAVAIESARAFTAQREEAWTINALLQVAENLARVSSLSDLLLTIVRLPPLLLGCDRCYCLAWNRTQGGFVPLEVYGLNDEQRLALIGKRIEEDAAPPLAEARRTLAPVTLRETARPAVFPSPPDPIVDGVILLQPLTSRGAVLGMLVAEHDGATALSARALTLYAGVANQVAGALESALLAQEAAEASRLEEELRVAREIQTALLPAHVPAVPGWDVAADWRSARLVGGDFYDFWRLPIARSVGSANLDVPPFGFVIADVSDKGVPAALFMALSRSLVRAAALDGSSPGVALSRANRWISRDTDSSMFVTLFYGVLHTERGVLRYACGGHNPPLLMRAADGDVTQLTTPGIALGVLDEATIGEAEVEMHPGDVLVCYTDGVTEAIDDAEEPFDVVRLIEVVARHRTRSAAEIVHAIVAALQAFTAQRPPFDDITLVVIKRDPNDS